jgi:hypothetical protein
VPPVELEALLALNERVVYVVEEGHPRGLPALRQLEAELLTELGWIAPVLRDCDEYRQGVELLQRLRAAIVAEVILEADQAVLDL